MLWTGNISTSNALRILDRTSLIKGLFSIVLLALVDANYMFRYIDVGCNGTVSDGGMYRNSTLSTALSANSLNVPAEQPPQGYDVLLPLHSEDYQRNIASSITD